MAQGTARQWRFAAHTPGEETMQKNFAHAAIAAPVLCLVAWKRVN